jgi:hypothetical protein
MRRRTRAAIATAVAAMSLLLAIPAAAQADWGAIFIDPGNGASGVSYDYNTEAGAKHRARNECASPGCRLAVAVFDAYGAVVLKHNGVFVAGYGRTRNLAFLRAKERAHEQSAKRYAWVYSG